MTTLEDAKDKDIAYMVEQANKLIDSEALFRGQWEVEIAENIKNLETIARLKAENAELRAAAGEKK